VVGQHEHPSAEAGERGFLSAPRLER
jgi:hypothetical protein